MADRRTPQVYTSRGPTSGEDWRAVALALNEGMAACRVGQQELAQRSGVSVSTLRAIQHGCGSRRVQNKTLAAIAGALGWPEDHLTRMLLAAQTRTDTTDPIDMADAQGQVAAMLARIDDRLREMNERLRTIEKAVAGRSQPSGPAPAEWSSPAE